jgi:hypothetical protein
MIKEGQERAHKHGGIDHEAWRTSEDTESKTGLAKTEG